MCGIIVSTLDIPLEAYKFVKNRGPDETNIIKHRDINFIHFLLHLTGEKTLQPIIDGDIVCIFNGEIYNYKEIDINSKSDSHSIISCYKKYGDEFVKYLDGEFVIVLFDFKNKKLIISSDIFKTKPLFYNVGKTITISSYISSCKKIKEGTYSEINPNEVLVFSLEKKKGKRKLLKKYKIYDFDLEQKKDTYVDFISAFERAVLKRYPEKNVPLISLSSGLDSGAIACCLNKYNKRSLYVTIPKNEIEETIMERQKILGNQHLIINLEEEEKKRWRKVLENDCEQFIWDWKYHPKVPKDYDNGFDMGSMLGKSKIIDISKKKNKNIRVLFSGIGADEIFSSNYYYSRGWGQVGFEFPEDLKPVFPWPNFYRGTMENYLKGDEYVGGCFGFETRYPFCDKDLVQEFLWLKRELKNDYKGCGYKPPLLYYLYNEKFPFHIKKLGFDV